MDHTEEDQSLLCAQAERPCGCNLRVCVCVCNEASWKVDALQFHGWPKSLCWPKGQVQDPNVLHIYLHGPSPIHSRILSTSDFSLNTRFDALWAIWEWSPPPLLFGCNDVGGQWNFCATSWHLGIKLSGWCVYIMMSLFQRKDHIGFNQIILWSRCDRLQMVKGIVHPKAKILL